MGPLYIGGAEVPCTGSTSVRDRARIGRLDAHLKPSSVPLEQGMLFWFFWPIKRADYRALVRSTHTESCSMAGCRRHQLEHESVFVWGDVVVLGTSSGDPHLLQGHRYARLEPIRQAPFARSEEPRTPVSWNPNWGALRVERARTCNGT